MGLYLPPFSLTLYLFAHSPVCSFGLKKEVGMFLSQPPLHGDGHVCVCAYVFMCGCVGSEVSVVVSVLGKWSRFLSPNM